MKTNIIRRDACEEVKGTVVVIDVIRAFTTAAYAFHRGVEEILLVGSIEEAFSLKKMEPELYLMGELNGVPIERFDFGNSPYEISKKDLFGKRLVQRTSSGTQGVVACKRADRILTSSFVVAQATLEYLRKLQPDEVTFVVTGMQKGGWEDLALAEYLSSALKEESVDPQSYLQKVIESPSGKLFDGSIPHFPKEDLEHVVKIDAFDFAMQVEKAGDRLIMKPVN